MPLLKSSDSANGSFLPEDYIRARAERRNLVISIVLFAIVSFGVIAAFFVTNKQVTDIRTLQEQINREYALEASKIEQLKQLEAQKEEMLQKAEITTALIEKVPRSILLAELINRMPRQLTLSQLHLEGKRIVTRPEPRKTQQDARSRSLTTSVANQQQAENAPPAAPRYEFSIELVGLAGADTEVADYHAALLECPLLDNVELVSSKDVKIDDIRMREFTIEATLRENADARQIEPLEVPRLHSLPGSPAVSPASYQESDQPDSTQSRPDPWRLW